MEKLGPVRTLWIARGILPQLRTSIAVAVVQSRGGKTKYGGITRDPLIHMKQKLGKKNQQKHAKIPLMSEERKQMMLTLPVSTASLNQYISTYVPPEKFSKAPLYTRLGLRQRWTRFKEGLKIIYSGAMIKRKLRKVDPYRPIEFARKAQEQFVRINEAIQKKDKYLLRELATENASESLKKAFEHKRFMWELVEEIERPRIVSARVAPLQTKENLFGQVIVRLHTKQLLAIYDSASRLVQGHPTKPKAVIDYVVLERNLTLDDASWRIAGKLPPQRPLKRETEV